MLPSAVMVHDQLESQCCGPALLSHDISAPSRNLGVWLPPPARYETAATLMLRGMLKPDNPAHAAILAQFDGGW